MTSSPTESPLVHAVNVTKSFGDNQVLKGIDMDVQLGDPQRLDIERFPDLFLGGTMLLVMLLRPGGLLGDRDLAGWLRRRTYRRPPPTGEEPRAGSNTLVAAEIEVHFGG